MQANEFQKLTQTTAIYPFAGTSYSDEFYYLALGLAGEAGEIAGKISKLYRDGEIDFKDIAKELGDVLWFCARLADAMEVPLEDIMQANADKLKDRLQRGVIGGSGDNR